MQSASCPHEPLEEESPCFHGWGPEMRRLQGRRDKHREWGPAPPSALCPQRLLLSCPRLQWKQLGACATTQMLLFRASVGAGGRWSVPPKTDLEGLSVELTPGLEEPHPIRQRFWALPQLRIPQPWGHKSRLVLLSELPSGLEHGPSPHLLLCCTGRAIGDVLIPRRI